MPACTYRTCTVYIQVHRSLLCRRPGLQARRHFSRSNTPPFQRCTGRFTQPCYYSLIKMECLFCVSLLSNCHLIIATTHSSKTNRYVFSPFIVHRMCHELPYSTRYITTAYETTFSAITIQYHFRIFRSLFMKLFASYTCQGTVICATLVPHP